MFITAISISLIAMLVNLLLTLRASFGNLNSVSRLRAVGLYYRALSP